MQSNSIRLPRVMRGHTRHGLRGPEPLPLRWRRAKRWAERARSCLDLEGLRRMIAAERVGFG